MEAEAPAAVTSRWRCPHSLVGGGLWGLSYFICRLDRRRFQGSLT